MKVTPERLNQASQDGWNDGVRRESKIWDTWSAAEQKNPILRAEYQIAFKNAEAHWSTDPQAMHAMLYVAKPEATRSAVAPAEQESTSPKRKHGYGI